MPASPEQSGAVQPTLGGFIRTPGEIKEDINMDYAKCLKCKCIECKLEQCDPNCKVCETCENNGCNDCFDDENI
jgi:hypothetical protein